MSGGVRALAGLLSILLLSAGLTQASHAAPRRAAAQARLEQSLHALRLEKAARTPAERKLDSNLLYACRARRGERLAQGFAAPRSVRWARDGTTLVDLDATVSDALLAAIESLGGRVLSAHARFDAIRAHLPEPAIGVLAARSDVHGIRPADRHQIRKVNSSEGDAAHRAAEIRSLLGVDGSGVAIGVLSDGVDTLADRQATGDLPPGVTVLAEDPTCLPPDPPDDVCDEGTAMLEIVFDLAPGSPLLFATALGGKATFAANILALEAAGADVIVDDVGYFAEGVFQDDVVAAAVDTVTAAGVLYVAAAGNDGSQGKGTSGVWEGDFVDSGTTSGMPASPLHDFGSGVVENEILADSDTFALKWSDPLGASGNDYDLLLTDCAGNVSVSGSTIQDGDDDPIEVIDSVGFDDSGSCLVVAKFAGAGLDRFVQVHAFEGELAVSTNGGLYGHPGARGALAVAAVDWSLAGGPGGSFDGSETVQTYSSDGPRRVYYEDDGTEITPGNVSSTGGELRQKPEVAAADCVSTDTPGFASLCGTSAAAPHVAAIGALLLEAGGVTTNAGDVRASLESGTLDIEAVGVDELSGHGIVDARLAANEVLLLPEPRALPLLAAGATLVSALARRRSTFRPGSVGGGVCCRSGGDR